MFSEIDPSMLPCVFLFAWLCGTAATTATPHPPGPAAVAYAIVLEVYPEGSVIADTAVEIARAMIPTPPFQNAEP